MVISIQEYLNTGYRPDCDYIDGCVVERNVGELPHSRLMAIFLYFFTLHRDEWMTESFPSVRVQINPTRILVPDVVLCAVHNPDYLIVRTPPILCVEIFGSNDTPCGIQKRADDYSRMGILATWVVDPWRDRAYSSGPDGKLHPVEDRFTVGASPITITLSEVFAERKRLERRYTSAT